MKKAKRIPTIALAGNPNCGKTTLFNLLTGSTQRIGNWAGVTVEKKEGYFELGGRRIRVVDLPGIYALTAASEDERVAQDYLLSGDADLVLNVLDSSNLERNLYLTTQLLEMQLPVCLAANMLDVAKRHHTEISLPTLQEQLGVPVCGITAVNKNSYHHLFHMLDDALAEIPKAACAITYNADVEAAIAHWSEGLSETAAAMRITPRLAAIKFLENEQTCVKCAEKLGEINEDTRGYNRLHAEDMLGDAPEFVMADARYGHIREVCRRVVSQGPRHRSFTDAIDSVLLHKFLGLPIFALTMFLVFWVTLAGGNVFVDFFDQFFGTVLVEGMTALLWGMGAPGWVVALLAGGVGTGLQTVATFIPSIFFMFLMLSLLEDSGYMARAAFVMDRFMSWLGLPGKAFVPMLVGFGCSVPALMATRTLEHRRDRLFTQFLIPFMSCGAKMPVYVLFGAAFFGASAPWMVFGIYMAGIALALFVGLFLRHSLFKGATQPFVMELPAYHFPRPASVMRHTWMRLRDFIFRAGAVVLVMMALLGFFNALGTDGTFGAQDSEYSVLSSAGRAITPLFGPMGVEEDNWQASVALLSGLFAKEAVVTTLNSLYGQQGMLQEEAQFAPFAGTWSAIRSIGVNLGLLEGEKSHDKEGLGGYLRANFGKGRLQAFAYLLFVLLYMPCLAAMGTAVREMGKAYALLLALMQTCLGWSVATLFYQATLGHEVFYISVALGLLGLIALTLASLGRIKA